MLQEHRGMCVGGNYAAGVVHSAQLEVQMKGWQHATLSLQRIRYIAVHSHCRRLPLEQPS